MLLEISANILDLIKIDYKGYHEYSFYTIVTLDDIEIAFCRFEGIYYFNRNKRLLDKCYDIYSVSVNEEFRGKGVATRMLKESIEIARKRGAKSLFLTSSYLAIPLYERLGFKKINSLYNPCMKMDL